MFEGRKVAVVIPARNEAAHLPQVLRNLPEFIDSVYVVDDGSTDGTAAGAHAVGDPRVHVLRNARSRGVGAATLLGMQQALQDGAALLVKVDGDGQMDPQQIPKLLQPLLYEDYGYAKANRFLHTDALRRMPVVRLLGNVLLTFLTKLASGYWRIFDPQNGFVAIRAEHFQCLPHDKIAHDFFFENDMLIHLNIQGVRVKDVPIPARYGDEESDLPIWKVLLTSPPHGFCTVRGGGFGKNTFCEISLRLPSFGYSAPPASLRAVLRPASLGLIFVYGPGRAHWYGDVKCSAIPDWL